MLTLTDVRAGYGAVPVLHGLDLSLERGERVVVLGRNGVGKTTLLRAIVGQIPLDSGRVEVDGTDMASMATHQRARRGVAYVPQGRRIFGSLSVRDNLRVAGFATRQSEIDAKLDEVLEELPALTAKLSHRGGSLSGGQQQILALGRALMTSPSLLLLDEPAEGIQPSIVAEIGEIVVRLNEQRGITVLLVEQNLDFASQVAERAVLMDRGEVVRELLVNDLLHDQELQHEYLGV